MFLRLKRFMIICLLIIPTAQGRGIDEILQTMNAKIYETFPPETILPIIEKAMKDSFNDVVSLVLHAMEDDFLESYSVDFTKAYLASLKGNTQNQFSLETKAHLQTLAINQGRVILHWQDDNWIPILLSAAQSCKAETNADLLGLMTDPTINVRQAFTLTRQCIDKNGAFSDRFHNELKHKQRLLILTFDRYLVQNKLPVQKKRFYHWPVQIKHISN